VSGATVHERIVKLKEKGVLEGFYIRVNPKKTGRTVTGFVGLITSQNKGLRQLIEEIKKIKEIEEAYTVTGKYDFLIKLRAADIDDLQRLLTDRISCISGVIRHETMIAMTTILDRAEPLLGPDVAGSKV
jgi:Lrp/AsnC family transcriptional regulator for asnA, asnC and gidA